MTESADEDIARLFYHALRRAESLVGMARCDSAEVGWRSADSACHALSELLPCVDKLLFDADVRQRLELCPPSGCTPDGADLAGSKLRNISWHHLACDLVHEVAMKAIEWIDADARFLFVERAPGEDDFEYVVRPHTDDDKVVYHDVRRLKPGEKRAARLAEMQGHIRERGHTCWPEIAGALRETGLNSDHFERTWAGVRREWLEIKRTGGAPSVVESTVWITVGEAASLSGIEPSIISAAVSDGRIKSNGKSRHERRVDSADLNRWLLDRMRRQRTRQKSDGTIGEPPLGKLYWQGDGDDA